MDAKTLVRKVYGAFGAGRIVWGELGDSMAAFDKAVEQVEVYFDFPAEADKAKIRGINDQKLFGV